MNKIFNWTIGSFFKTLGRVIAYIGIGLLIFILISKFDVKGLLIPRLNALTTDSYKVTYNYNSDYVINNYDSSFFGENGKLEEMRDFLNKFDKNTRNCKWLLTFTKNDIIVFIDYDLNSEFFINPTLWQNSTRININSNTKSGQSSTNSYSYYYTLSKYPTFATFKNDIQNNGGSGKRNEYTYNNGYQLSISTSDLRYTNLDFFTIANNYIIPYASNTDIVNNCYGSVCGNSSGLVEHFIINNITDYVPAYYDLYGYQKPTSSMKPNQSLLYSNDIIIQTSHIHDSDMVTSFRYSYNGTAPVFSSVDFYGLVNDNGLYHYELIDYNTIHFIENSTNLVLQCHSNPCIMGFDSDSIYTNNLPNYQYIYIKIKYENPVLYNSNTFRYENSSPYIVQSIANDISKESLFLQLESSGINTYTFSNSDSSQNTQFVYSDVISNDVLYNKPNFIDLQNNALLVSDIEVLNKKSKYGTFHQVVFNNYNLAHNTGIIMNLYMNDMNQISGASGSFQILYFITPNIYWGNSVYTSDRSSVVYKYIDDNGNSQSNTLYGDFHNYLSEYTNVDYYFNIVSGIMSDDFYGLSGLVLTPLTYIQSLSNQVCSNITFPVPFTNNSITIPCLSSIYNNYIPSILNIWHIVIYGIICYAIGVNLFKTIKDTLEVDKNDIEVIDL